MKAPDADIFEKIASQTLDRLPEPFKSWLKDVIVRIDDFPSEDVVAEMELASPFDILGLYHGTAIGDKSVDHSGALPDIIFLYRRPILDYWCAYDETLEHLIAHVLIHEIGHHFGLSDEDMHAIEAAAEAAAKKNGAQG